MTELRKKSLEILREHGCDETTYTGEPMELIRGDLMIAYPNGIDGFAHEELANDIYSLSTTERGWAEPIKVEIDGDGSHWGFTDLYPEVERKLREALESGKPFKTDWISSKKEIGGWAMFREFINGEISIVGQMSMDEAGDLVYDALPDGVDLDEETVDEIVDDYEMSDEGIYETESTVTVPGNSTLDDVLEAVSKLFGALDNTLKASFEIMKSIVAERIGDDNK